jgi:hypothetical protein
VNPQSATTEVAGRKSEPAVLHGRWLLVARATWGALATLAIGLFVASVPVAYARYGTLCEGVQCDYFQLSPEGAKVLQGWNLSIDFYAAYNIAFDIVYALGFWVTGVTLFWRRSAARMVLCASIAFVTFGARNPLDALADAYPGWALPVEIVYFVGSASFFVLFCVFPDGRFVPGWTRATAAAWIASELLYSFFPNLPFSPQNWPPPIYIIFIMGLLGSLVVAQIYRYRRVSGEKERQQTKWVVFGLAAAIIVLIGVSLIGRIYAPPQVLYEMGGLAIINLSFLLIPLSISVAILHHHLWDIDLIIRRSLVYVPLSAVLTTVFVITDTLLLPRLLRSILGMEDSSLTTVVSGVIIAVLFKPLRSRIEAGVNRLVDWFVGGTRAAARREEDTFISPPSD